MKIIVNRIRIDSKCGQSGARMTKFHGEKIAFNESDKIAPQKAARLEKWRRKGLTPLPQLENLF